MPTGEGDGDATLSPQEAFGLLGNDTRVGILQTLWEEFESGLGDNALAYSELFERVDITDSGNFSYHLEKLTGPFVRHTADGYELKQTGINLLRAVVSGTVTADPALDPTPVDAACPICGAELEVRYRDEALLATCSSCEGLRSWGDQEGFVFIGIVPPVLMEQRSAEEAFHSAVTFTMYQIAALYHGVCPHCGGISERTLEICPDHEPGRDTRCPTCDRYHQTEAWMVCRTCKWRVFPPATLAVITDPSVTAFYHDHGIVHQFASWDGLVRSFDIEELVVARDPLRVRFEVPGTDDRLRLVVDEDLNVVDRNRRSRESVGT